MKAKNQKRAARLTHGLDAYETQHGSLAGLTSQRRKDCLIEQLIESERRAEFLVLLQSRQSTPNQLDPTTIYFDPLRAAVEASRHSDVDEALWLVLLATLCAKTPRSGFGRARTIYEGKPGGPWTWNKVSSNIRAFQGWLDHNESRIRAIPGGCGNHRKYEGVGGTTRIGAGATVESFVEWVLPIGGPAAYFADAYQRSGNDAGACFEILFQEMDCVTRFGRTGKFDFLSTLGLLGIAQITPPRAYLRNATGPKDGANLLFYNSTNTTTSPERLETRLGVLNHYLGVGMKVLEDALCNWQKSPASFVPFRG